MCQRVTCVRCGKPTWAGCGRHVEQALAGVSRADRCSCPRSFVARLLGLRTTRAPAADAARRAS